MFDGIVCAKEDTERKAAATVAQTNECCIISLLPKNAELYLEQVQ